ncbi:succinate dehydrogenase cytochrome b560 subunit, mitochondrial-like [Babylonia areolata]|uniref:succinate dehydrogenase cytochrome b560 subunit, mitochondrial-like n=1 Tax=Babylonia areolata TaxID=304850 RepID=UPI003FD42A57
MAALVRILGRQCLLQRQGVFMQKRVAQASSSAYDEMKSYWNKNRQLRRPLSPFLTVYKPHLAMMTSLTHRVTGVVMMCAAAGLSITLMVLPEDFTHYVNLVKDLEISPIIIYGAKIILAFPVTYHFLNGIRHLAWDAGLGFGLPTLYKSAYFVMGLTAVIVSYFVFGM